MSRASPLAKHILSSAILDLLVKAYAEELARERDVAEGFIKEMAKRVAGDKALDFDGMKQEVQRAIEIYETEIAGRPIASNIDTSVEAALRRPGRKSTRASRALPAPLCAGLPKRCVARKKTAANVMSRARRCSTIANVMLRSQPTTARPPATRLLLSPKPSTGRGP